MYFLLPWPFLAQTFQIADTLYYSYLIKKTNFLNIENISVTFCCKRKLNIAFIFCRDCLDDIFHFYFLLDQTGFLKTAYLIEYSYLLNICFNPNIEKSILNDIKKNRGCSMVIFYAN